MCGISLLRPNAAVFVDVDPIISENAIIELAIVL
jgi:hypothetical protein